MCSSRVGENCEYVGEWEHTVLPYGGVTRLPFSFSERSPVSGLRQAIQGKRGDSQEGGKPQVVYPLVRPRGVSAISLASQAAKCDFCFVQSAQSTTPSGGAAMPKACFSSNYSVSQPVPPAGKFSFYGIIVPQFFRRFLHKMMKDFLRQHRTIKAAALCGNFMS